MTRYVIDTSAWITSRRQPELRRHVNALLLADKLVMTHPVQHELLYEARNAQEFRDIRLELGLMPLASIDEAAWNAAFNMFEALAERGGMHQRQVGLNDALVAAAAERIGAPILHYDHHFDLIAEVTGQPTEWIAPRGSL